MSGKPIFVSRHPEARQWADQNGIHADFCDELDLEAIKAGDTVLGILPVHVAAEVCRRGARYFHLAIDVPLEQRGKVLTPDEMDRHNARLVEISLLDKAVDKKRVAPPQRAFAHRLGKAYTLAPAARRLLLLLLFAVAVTALSEPAVNILNIVLDAFSGRAGEDPALPYLLVNAFFLMILGFVALAAGLLVSRAFRNWTSPVASLEPVPSKRPVPSRAVLIMALSSPPANAPQGEEALKALEAFGLNAFTAENESNQPEAVPLEAMRHPWVQNIRALLPHRHRLRAIFVVPSATGRAPSAPLSPRFATFVRTLFENTGQAPPIIYAVNSEGGVIDLLSIDTTHAIIGCDYNSYEALLASFESAAAFATERLKFDLADICVDVTPGPKPVSIAGAIMTLNRDSIISYVNTETGEVTFHNGKLDYGLFVDQIG